MDVSQADNFVKIWWNLPFSNPKPDLHNINAHTKFGENPLMFTQVIIRKRKMDGRMDVRQTDGQTDGLTHGIPTWNHNTPPLLCVKCRYLIVRWWWRFGVLHPYQHYMSYPDNVKVIMIGSLQWSTVQSWAEFCLQTWNLWSEVRSTNHLDTSKKKVRKNCRSRSDCS